VSRPSAPPPFAARDHRREGPSRSTRSRSKTGNARQDEVGGLMSLLEYLPRAELDDLHHGPGPFPAPSAAPPISRPTSKSCSTETIAATQHFTDYTLVLALNYGARAEVGDAARAYAAAVAGRPARNPPTPPGPPSAATSTTGRPPRSRPAHPHLRRDRASATSSSCQCRLRGDGLHARPLARFRQGRPRRPPSPTTAAASAAYGLTTEQN